MSGDALARAVALGAEGQDPAPVALMRILAEAQTEVMARDALAAARATAAPAQAEALRRLERLWAAQPQAWRVVRETLAVAHHAQASHDPDATLQHWANVFDQLAASSPEAAVALYSLGDSALLDAATAEVVGFMEAHDLLGQNRDGLDLGCGIGRFLQALAPRLRQVTGLDNSAGMVAEARRRCTGLPNVTVHQGSGRGLDGVADRSLDLVLAADVFPYLVQAGGTLVADHFANIGHALRPGGAALILNYAYRASREEDRADVEAHGREAGLWIAHWGVGEFETWDAVAILLRRHG